MLNNPARNKACSSAQRSQGAASLAIKRTERGNGIEDLYQQGCAKLRLPKNHHGGNIEAVMINTSGGMTGGDSLSWRFSAREHTGLTVTTQACERLYRSSEDCAQIDVDLEVEDNASLFWLPQETILFDRSHTKRQIRVKLAGRASLLMVEPLVFGRKEMGETLTQVTFLDDWTVSSDGMMIHKEATRFQGDAQDLLNQRAVMDGNLAVASVLLVTRLDRDNLGTRLDAVRSHCREAAAASYWQIGETGKLLARIAARDSYELRKTLIPIIKVLSNDAPLPKTWSV